MSHQELRSGLPAPTIASSPLTKVWPVDLLTPPLAPAPPPCHSAPSALLLLMGGVGGRGDPSGVGRGDGRGMGNVAALTPLCGVPWREQGRLVTPPPLPPTALLPASVEAGEGVHKLLMPATRRCSSSHCTLSLNRASRSELSWACESESGSESERAGVSAVLV